MTCKTYSHTAPDGQQVTAIVCRRGVPKAAPCSAPGCSREHERLCDFPLTGSRQGETCDAKLCPSHATTVYDDRDYCPAHARAAKAIGLMP